jgi:hypothetical protein
VYGQQLFRSPQLKEYYKKCAKLGNGLRVIVEDRVPNEDEGNENCNTCLPSDLWRWANRFAVLEHPVFNRMKLEIPHTSYSEPLLFPEIPDLILLIAGEPKGYGNPSADDMVDGIADIWKGYSKKFAEKHGKYPRIIKLHFEQATRSRIQDAIENPLAQPDRMHVYQPRPLTGLIHWIGRADVERDNLRSLWVRGDKHELQELHPERLVLFLKGARERRIHWQFFFLCSYRKEQDMTPIPTTGCSQVIEPLVLKAGVPSVLVLKRPVWRDSALALATEFYNKLLEPYYETRLPERGIPKTLLEVRKSLHQDFRDGTEACYYAWTSPLLVMQQTGEPPLPVPLQGEEAEEEKVLSKKNKNARRDIVEQGEEAVERLVDLHARASFVKEEAEEMEDRGFERLQEQMRRLEDGIPEMSDEEWKQVLQEAIKSAESLMEAKAVTRKGEEKIAQELQSWISSAHTMI